MDLFIYPTYHGQNILNIHHNFLRKGKRFDAVILNLEPEKEKLSLGIKQLSEDPWLKEIPEKFKVGEVYNARSN